MSEHHVLRASPETCHWGFFDAGLKPVLAVASGDTVAMECVSGGPDVLPDGDGFDILPDHLAIHRGLEQRLGAHILTGPIAVEGAEPGDVLEIQILSIDPRQNWGYTRIRPLSGTLPEDFPIRRIWHTRIDRQRGIATVPWGRSEEHTSELQSRPHLVCRLLLEKKKKILYRSSPEKKTKPTYKHFYSLDKN